MNSVGVNIPDLAEGEPEIERGMRSRDEIERLGWQFRRSVNDLLSVEVGPALEMPLTDDQIAEEAPAACPICRATSTIKTATQTVCMVCGHREMING